MGPNLRIGPPQPGGLQLQHPLGVPNTMAPPIPQQTLPPPPLQPVMPAPGMYSKWHSPSQGTAIVMPGVPVPPIPQPQTPGVLIDQNQPPSAPTSPVGPYPVSSPYPATPGPYYPTVEAPQPGIMPTMQSFWDRFKKPILIGGGIAGGLGLIALIAVAASKRRAPTPY